MHVEVVCYAGHKGAERPLRFRLDQADYVVEQVIAQWYAPDAAFFRVRVTTGDVYLLRHSQGPGEGKWTLEPDRSVRPCPRPVRPL